MTTDPKAELDMAQFIALLEQPSLSAEAEDKINDLWNEPIICTQEISDEVERNELPPSSEDDLQDSSFVLDTLLMFF